MIAYCYASGLIQFALDVPNGAIIIGKAKEAAVLKDFISRNARHGYDTKVVNGAVVKVEGSDSLLVPGVPEAANQVEAAKALETWMNRLKVNTPEGVEIY